MHLLGTAVAFQETTPSYNAASGPKNLWPPTRMEKKIHDIYRTGDLGENCPHCHANVFPNRVQTAQVGHIQNWQIQESIFSGKEKIMTEWEVVTASSIGKHAPDRRSSAAWDLRILTNLAEPWEEDGYDTGGTAVIAHGKSCWKSETQWTNNCFLLQHL